jgi:hypothetical protein
MGELRCNLRACARVWSLEGVASAGTDQPAPPLHSEGVAVRYQYAFRILSDHLKIPKVCH